MSARMTFPSSPDALYHLDSHADAESIADQLLARQSQLQALLAMTYGDAGEVFRRLNHTHQDNYLWACSMIAHEAQELTDALQARWKTEGRAAA